MKPRDNRDLQIKKIIDWNQEKMGKALTDAQKEAIRREVTDKVMKKVYGEDRK